MLLDEPLSALDLKLRQHMRAELRAIQKRTNVTFIYITHDQGEALAMSDRVAVMSQGKIQQISTPQDIYNAPVNGFVASFVGENNIFKGKVKSIDGTKCSFETDAGIFTATLGPAVDANTIARLYVRPEYSRLQATPAEGNSLPVTVTDISFEGNFIHVHAADKTGRHVMIETRNDGTVTLPAVGSQNYLCFDAANARVLADQGMKDPSIDE
jgi:spermidine/putrescine transport system ATP-binding protein